MRRQQRGRSLPGAVGALCRALPARSRPNPDTLRCAKFDRPQASLDFWRLLYALLKQIHGRKWAESDAIDNQIRFVKAALWYHGYYRPELYRLPSDGSVGSRELLLAFSWLLHRISLLEQLLARNRVKTGDETSVCTCEDDLSNSLKGTTEEAPEPGLEGGVDVRYLQWLNGRLRFQWRSLHAQHQEQCRLLHKLLQLLESETMQLEAFLEWKQLEPVYWQWMETVLDNMVEEGNMCESQDTHVEGSELPKVTSCCPWADRLTGQIDRLSRDLTALRDQLHKLVTHRKAAWCEKVKTREEELEKEGFSATARKIQESVELKLLDLAYLCAPPKKRMHGSHRLVFRSKHPASKMVFGRSVSKESVSTVSATEVIRELQIREASLARELKQLQEESRQRLDEVAEGLDGVICISP
ncbi:tubulin epsilon and delta complex protein 1 isoform X2 [Melopsittacus undulatus]|uniref:tubulin epsilon and delta complex protein 1 isoform X2 n=1 Tax=Melopsittacus undulatus TaxID=13146 RepID=UPI00146F05E5|nr:tubulin epsilon and delta complex protein 1 isoform X2 [Melopsittacus undulatus]